jgi:hypothetical protein
VVAVAVVLVEKVIIEEVVVVAVLLEGPVVEIDDVLDICDEERLVEEMPTEELDIVELLEDIDEEDEVVVDWVAEPVSKTFVDPPSLQNVSIEP